jgi:LmbE family N-acetylglucosaminyl deacetylase
MREILFLHLTDGAPRDMKDAAANGFSTREAYAAARRQELQEALRAGGVAASAMIALEYADQEASFHLAEIARELAHHFRRVQAEAVLTHPYEGGHPDHDAAAFAVHAAVNLLPAGDRPQIVEFTSYHANAGTIETGQFLGGPADDETICPLDPEQRTRKELMLACYRTQSATLRQFKTGEERFRPAPQYNFEAPPHEGPLYYERFPWQMTGPRFRALAHAAKRDLGLC